MAGGSTAARWQFGGPQIGIITISFHSDIATFIYRSDLCTDIANYCNRIYICSRVIDTYCVVRSKR